MLETYHKMVEKQVSMIRKHHNQCRPTQITVRKRHTTLTVTRHQEDKQSKATSSLFKIIAKLESKEHKNQTSINKGLKHIAITESEAPGQIYMYIVQLFTVDKASMKMSRCYINETIRC